MSLVLNVGGRALVADEERRDVVAAVQKAFAALESEIRRRMEMLAGSENYERPARSAQLRRVSSVTRKVLPRARAGRRDAG
jgi:hypothetical protein